MRGINIGEIFIWRGYIQIGGLHIRNMNEIFLRERYTHGRGIYMGEVYKQKRYIYRAGIYMRHIGGIYI